MYYWLLTFDFSFKYSSPIQFVFNSIYMKFYSSIWLTLFRLSNLRLLLLLFVANSIEKLENLNEMRTCCSIWWLSILLSHTIYLFIYFHLKKHPIGFSNMYFKTFSVSSNQHFSTISVVFFVAQISLFATDIKVNHLSYQVQFLI